ncbi:hypothetical protein ANN_18603 [Periplaneta americana]|uniref:Uncharacterized protein n=1 Tax=Periplaneta americana TaxID=6978 RepID=A0ABQ8SQ90_PERAM|nr:hypothetical protein ANN_18603 [Periplaneta americana]
MKMIVMLNTMAYEVPPESVSKRRKMESQKIEAKEQSRSAMWLVNERHSEITRSLLEVTAFLCFGLGFKLHLKFHHTTWCPYQWLTEQKSAE